MQALLGASPELQQELAAAMNRMQMAQDSLRTATCRWSGAQHRPRRRGPSRVTPAGAPCRAPSTAGPASGRDDGTAQPRLGGRVEHHRVLDAQRALHLAPGPRGYAGRRPATRDRRRRALAGAGGRHFLQPSAGRDRRRAHLHRAGGRQRHIALAFYPDGALHVRGLQESRGPACAGRHQRATRAGRSSTRPRPRRASQTFLALQSYPS